MRRIVAGETDSIAAGYTTVRPSEPDDYRRLCATGAPDFIVHRWCASDTDGETALRLGFDSVLLLSQALLRAGLPHEVPALCLLPAGASPAFAALPALTQTVRAEQPLLAWKTVADAGDSLAVLAELRHPADGAQLSYRGGVRCVSEPEPFAPAAEQALPLRHGGTYLITGGAGGLGLTFARYLRERFAANIVLLGRTPAAEAWPRVTAALADTTAVRYVAGDVTRLADVERVVAAAKAQFGPLAGVLHAAGTLDDAFVLKKDLAAARRVLAPKLDGALALDAATRDEPLGCFVLFGSIASVAGNVGQCDYAFANAWLDAFAREREALRETGARAGRTVSIQWPLWQGGGMDVAPAVLAVKAPAHRAIDAATGLAMFETCLRARETVIAAVPADSLPVAKPATTLPAAAVAVGAVELPRVLAFLKSRFAELTQIPVERIEGREPLERYGIDSLLVMSFTRLLEKDFGPLSKTLLFEHQTLDALAAHFAARHTAKLAELLGGSAGPRPPSVAPEGMPPTVVAPVSAERPGAVAAPGPADAIAVIGVAGRFPQADDLDTFWENLAAGRDCITEVPPERWDLAAYYDGRRGEPGKTYNRWGGWLRDVDKFDAAFFRVPPREAEAMDPQERLFLETAWRTVEDAGYARAELRGRAVGVFVGIMYSQYQLLGLERSGDGRLLPLSASYASVANRVSYTFDWHGPSLAVDTMCSSSLTAIHLACDSLRKGETEVALAGGVNLTLHPLKDVGLAQGGFAASDGRCRSFGAGGDGYVPGEGVGAVLLKPLARALADGDRIHGVIRGTALNHGGKTNGYTVPNPKAQTAVIASALRAAGVGPETIGCVEAHGTGTALGDPIEIAGLAEAFAAGDPRRAVRCALGSVKSNIGHLEAAAGIAGLAKVLLQLRHKQLVPSLHSAETNPHIEFSDTPFAVQRAAAPWLAHGSGAGPVAPRRAGISSFGAGGANAHAIVEEFVETRPAPAEAPGTRHLFVLTAATRERLLAAVAGWQRWLAVTPAAQRPALAAAAFTLQVGREAFDERLAFTAGDWDDVARVLAAYAAGGTAGDALAGNARAARIGGATLVEGDASRGFVEGLVAARDLAALARWWIAGAEIPWRGLWPADTGRRASLPGYAFARDRHWVPELPGGPALPRRGSAAARLHPLVHENVSTLRGVAFRTVLSADEPVLRDHTVEGRRVLPGAAALELVRHAAERATGGAAVRLTDWVWLRPAAAEGAGTLELTVTLTPRPDGRLDAELTLADGQVCARALADPIATPPAPARLDLEAIRARCTQAVSPANLYDGYARAGLVYGPAFRVVTGLAHAAGEVLGRLELPAVWTEPGLVLHPALLDGAFQSLAPLAAETTGAGLPFAVKTVLCHAPLPARCWVHGNVAADEGAVRRYDLTLVGDDGTVLAQVEGLATRRVETPRGELLAFRPVWRDVPASGVGVQLAGRTVLLFDDGDDLGAALSAAGATVRRAVIGAQFAAGGAAIVLRPEAPEDFVRLVADTKPDAVIHRWAMAPAGADTFARGIGSVHLLTQALARANLKPAGGLPFLFVYPAGEPVHAGVGAYAKTARQEHPSLALRTLGVDAGCPAAALVAELAESALDVRSRAGRREVAEIAELPLGAAERSAFKRGGVYLVTGGAGGLGLIVAEHLVRERHARVLLAGRSELTDAKRAALAALGDAAAYVRADVGDAAGARAAVAAAKARFGRLDGVIHAAGVLRDGLIRSKTLADFRAVSAPKLAAAQALDAATRDEPLDWFVLFSSTAGLLGNVGQADYAYANACLDAFAHAREAARGRGECQGRTVSINWPLWSDGGMGGEQGAARSAAFGLQVLDRAAGLELLERILAGAETQVWPAKGERETLLARVRPPVEAPAIAPAPPVVAEVSPAAPTGPAALPTRADVIEHLLGVFCALTKLPRAQVHADEPIESYGLDSIAVTTFAQMLERDLGDLSKTLLFEYPTLEAVADHLLANHGAALAKALRPAVAVGARPSPAASSASMGPRPPSVAAAVEERPGTAALPTVPSADAIAIIGVAGRYPQADTLAEFWANLAAGKDCIEPVPADRWDWRAYYDPEPMQPGRTSNKWGGWLRDVDKFDPLFFNLSPREAQFMDPQERLFLETVWSTLEDAACPRAALADRKVGVFVGVMYGQYQLFGVEERLKGNPVSLSSSFATIANRVSYFFNWRGPSLAVDTMCSSSLTAIHLACESIRRGECELAVAGGVNVTIHPEKDLILSQTGFSAKDGRCRAFGEGGEGYVPGEGVGAVLLKPLARAIADGDRIQGVIRASAINHGGRTNGYTVPNSRSQAEVVREALAQAAIDPATIGAIEAHGTGTSLGDPIEVAGLQQAFKDALARRPGGAPPPAPGFCALGSVKSNIGHCESAAGIAGVTKVLLQFRHGKLAPSLHAETPNPNIKFADTFFKVQRELGAWKRLQRDGTVLPRRAGVSSFGAGGANAHLILEEYLAPARAEVPVVPAEPQLLVLSAKNEARLREHAANLARWIAVRIDPASNGDGVALDARPAYLRDVAWTLQAGREALEERLAFVVSDLGEAAAKLAAWAKGGDATGFVRGNAKRPSDDVAQRRDDGSLAGALERLADAGDLAGLAELWVGGGAVDWRRLHRAARPASVALPAYPFAKVRCWVPQPETPAGGAARLAVRDDAEETPLPTQVSLSLMFFSDSSQVAAENRYRLVLEAAKFADRHGFEAVWTPERHFHPFGGIYSSPATLMAALAATTRRVRLRAGSVVLPLEDPLRVAEAWSVVDNLSDGRVDIGFASGWNPNDFALAPDVYPKLRDEWLRRIPEVQKLWRGESLARRNGKGETVQLRIYPEPRQKELPVWLTASRRLESFEDAARGGYNVLTMLQGTTLEQLAEKIARYRELRAQSGFDPAAGRVTLMLHTFVDPDEDRAREAVRKPFLDYIRSSLDAHMSAVEGGKRVSADDLQKMAEYSYERYCRQASLIGSPESCLAMVRACRAAGVDEIAALLDFGASNDAILAALPHLAALRRRIEQELPAAAATRSGTGILPAEVRTAENVPTRSAPVAPDSDPIRARFLLRDWTPAPVEPRDARARTVLIVSGADGPLERALAARHGGTGVRLLRTDTAPLRAGPPAAWDEALRAGPLPEWIYFIATPADGDDSVARTAAAQETGPLALHRLVQALVRAGAMKPGLSLRAVTCGAFATGADETPVPDGAGVTGMVASLAKEFPPLDFAAVDVTAGDGDDWTAVAAALAGEPAQRAGEKIALRGGQRLRLRLKLADDQPPARTRFRRGGVYLIVGGAGQVGVMLSRHLAATFGAKLVWMGRRPADARIAAAMAEVTALGGEVAYVPAHGEDAAALRAAVAEARARFGTLHGAVHSALVFQDERLGNLSEAECRAVLDAKTRGSAAIFAAVRDLDLDFLLFLGSAQSLFPEARRAAYAAACCFQDAFAVWARAQAAFPVQIVNWGFWRHGLDEALVPGLRAAGLGAIESDDGIAAIEALLGAGLPQVAYLQANDAALRRMGVADENAAPETPAAPPPPRRSLDDALAADLFD